VSYLFFLDFVDIALNNTSLDPRSFPIFFAKQMGDHKQGMFSQED